MGCQHISAAHQRDLELNLAVIRNHTMRGGLDLNGLAPIASGYLIVKVDILGEGINLIVVGVISLDVSLIASLQLALNLNCIRDILTNISNLRACLSCDAVALNSHSLVLQTKSVGCKHRTLRIFKGCTPVDLTGTSRAHSRRLNINGVTLLKRINLFLSQQNLAVIIGKQIREARVVNTLGWSISIELDIRAFIHHALVAITGTGDSGDIAELLTWVDLLLGNIRSERNVRSSTRLHKSGLEIIIVRSMAISHAALKGDSSVLTIVMHHKGVIPGLIRLNRRMRAITSRDTTTAEQRDIKCTIEVRGLLHSLTHIKGVRPKQLMIIIESRRASFTRLGFGGRNILLIVLIVLLARTTPEYLHRELGVIRVNTHVLVTLILTKVLGQTVDMENISNICTLLSVRLSNLRPDIRIRRVQRGLNPLTEFRDSATTQTLTRVLGDEPHPRAPRVRGGSLIEGDRMLAGAGERLRLSTQLHAAGRLDPVEVILDVSVGIDTAGVRNTLEDRVLRAGEVIPLRRHARAVDPMVTRLHADRHPVGDGLTLLNDVRGFGGDGGGEGHWGLGFVDGDAHHGVGGGTRSHAVMLLAEQLAAELLDLGISPIAKIVLDHRLDVVPMLREQIPPIIPIGSIPIRVHERRGQTDHTRFRRLAIGTGDGAVHGLIAGILYLSPVGSAHINTRRRKLLGQQLVDVGGRIRIRARIPTRRRITRHSAALIVGQPQQELGRQGTATTGITRIDQTAAAPADVGCTGCGSHHASRGEGRHSREKGNTLPQPFRLALGRSLGIMLLQLHNAP